MSGYQTIEALRPILHRGPPPTPVVSRELVGRSDVGSDRLAGYKPRRKGCATAAQVRQMIALREKGVSTYEIARQMDFARSTVQVHVRHVVVPDELKHVGRRRTEYDVAEAERLWSQGVTYKEIARRLGCHHSSVFYRLNGRSPAYKPRPQPTYSRRKDRHLDEIVSRVTGFTVSELRRTGATRSRCARARVLLQWLMRFKHPERPYLDIAKACGLTDHSTSMNAYKRLQGIVAQLGINTRGQTERVVRRVWEAEWPKASA